MNKKMKKSHFFSPSICKIMGNHRHFLLFERIFLLSDLKIHFMILLSFKKDDVHTFYRISWQNKQNTSKLSQRHKSDSIFVKKSYSLIDILLKLHNRSESVHINRLICFLTTRIYLRITLYLNRF